MSKRLIYGQGLYEKGKYLSNTKEYCLWGSMLSRCYSERNLSRRPNYKDCGVSENFKNFQYFAEWCNNQIGFGQKGFQLDKDILCRGERAIIYSEDTCCFIPPSLNMRFLRKDAKCVNFHKASELWQANISIKDRTLYLGSSKDKLGADILYNNHRAKVLKDILNENKDYLDPRVVSKVLEFIGENT